MNATRMKNIRRVSIEMGPHGQNGINHVNIILDEIYRLSEYEPDPIELTNLYWMMEYVIDHNGGIVFEQIYNQINLNRVSSLMMITILRHPFQFRKNIHNWHYFRDRAAKSVHGRGLNVNELFRGLF